jgi:uncharacterized membrane protein
MLLLLGIYTVADGHRLGDDVLLQGADFAGYAVCHRLTEHSFTIAGRQMPLCARCTGMHLGILLTGVVLAAAGRWRRSSFPPFLVLALLAGFLIIMAIDGINSYSTFFREDALLYEPTNPLRLITGLGAGLTLGIVMVPTLAQALWRSPESRAIVTGARELGLLVLLVSIAALLVLSNQPAILYVLGLMSAAGVLLVLAIINAVLLLAASGRTNRCERWREAILPLGLGAVLAVVEVAAIAIVRFELTGTLTGLPGL